MQPRSSQSHIKLVIAFSLVLLAAGAVPVAGDDTGILGRLFRWVAARRTRARRAPSSGQACRTAVRSAHQVPRFRPPGAVPHTRRRGRQTLTVCRQTPVRLRP